MVTQKNDPKFVQIYEERTKILVPSSSLAAVVPTKIPAFFNKLAKLNRDISILAYRVYALNIMDFNSPRRGDCKFELNLTKENITFADALCGTGARALRVAVEAPEIQGIYGNDLNRLAVEKAKLSAQINGVAHKCFFSSNDVHNFLAECKTNDEKKFAIVDLDPFGSPSPYIDSLLRSVRNGGLISITATDTAVLCGVYPNVCLRKYFGRPINNCFSNETAIRLLLSLISLLAARFEFIINPIFVHANLHYIRAYLTIERSRSKANKSYEKLGFIQYCFKCGNRTNIPMNPAASEFGVAKELCSQCEGSFYTIGGPLWSAQLFDKEFTYKMNCLRSIENGIVSSTDDKFDIEYNPNRYRSEGVIRFSSVQNFQRKSKIDPINKTLEVASMELDSIPYYFRSDEISSFLRKNPLPLRTIIDKLISNGFRASRTSLNPQAFKTDAHLSDIFSALR